MKIVGVVLAGGLSRRLGLLEIHLQKAKGIYLKNVNPPVDLERGKEGWRPY